MPQALKTFQRLLVATSLVALVGSPVEAISRSSYYTQQDVQTYDKTAGVCGNTQTSTTSTGTATPTKSMQEFIDTYGQAAFNVGKQYGIPYEAILAQAALESGMGRSELTTKGFNFFGIKAGSSWKGPVLVMKTKEEVNGQLVDTTASFRAYANAEAGFQGYGQFIRDNPRYSEALKYPGDPIKYIQAIKDAGYATDSQYVAKLTSLINAVTTYVASKNLFPPSSQVTPDVTPPATDESGTSGSNSGCVTNEVVAGTGDTARIVAIAEAELAKHPVEYDANVDKYTTGRNEAWCADFVSWVFKEAGSPFTGGNSGGWQQSFVPSLQEWFKAGKNGSEYFEVGEKEPQPGDVAFYIGAQTPDGGSTRHVNIVIVGGPLIMTTIGGNESDMVRKQTRGVSLGEDSLVGFGRIAQK